MGDVAQKELSRVMGEVYGEVGRMVATVFGCSPTGFAVRRGIEWEFEDPGGHKLIIRVKTADDGTSVLITPVSLTYPNGHVLTFG